LIFTKFSGMSRNWIVSLLSSTVPPQPISLVGEVPGALISATATQALLFFVNRTLTDMPSQPAFGHTRSGFGRTSTGRPGSAFSATALTFCCTCAARAAFSSAIALGMMRGHRITIPPACPFECEISGPRKRPSFAPPATASGPGPGVVPVLV
jgi:hypothetical protein